MNPALGKSLGNALRELGKQLSSPDPDPDPS